MNDVVAGTARTAGASVIAAGAGFLTRPCCLGPALLSITGGSAAGLSQVLANHHTAFAALSGVLLTASVWINIRWQAQTWNKWVAALSALAAFGLVARGFLF